MTVKQAVIDAIVIFAIAFGVPALLVGMDIDASSNQQEIQDANSTRSSAANS